MLLLLSIEIIFDLRNFLIPGEEKYNIVSEMAAPDFPNVTLAPVDQALFLCWYVGKGEAGGVECILLLKQQSEDHPS